MPAQHGDEPTVARRVTVRELFSAAVKTPKRRPYCDREKLTRLSKNLPKLGLIIIAYIQNIVNLSTR